MNRPDAVLALALELQHAAELLRVIAYTKPIVRNAFDEQYNLIHEAERMDELRERVLKEATC